MSGFIDALATLGGFGGFAAFITAIAGVVKIKRVEHSNKKIEKAACETREQLETNHGSSLRDAVNRIERMQKEQDRRFDLLLDQVKSLGHQVGDYRREQAIAAEDLHARKRNLELRTEKCNKH